ncbi:MAG: hypothetical protein ACREVI_11645 [Steroidobacteraceae bacterium]
MNRYWIGIALAAAVPVAGCGVLPDAYSGCDEIRPYQSARQQPPLKVPSGSELPDTRSALKIPEVNAPEVPVEPGHCIDHPPEYGAPPARAG